MLEIAVDRGASHGPVTNVENTRFAKTAAEPISIRRRWWHGDRMTKRKSSAMTAICERRVSARDVVCAWLVAVLIGVGTAGVSYAIDLARLHASAAQASAAHRSAAQHAC